LFPYFALVSSLHIIYYHLAKQVQREFHLPAGDFPNIDHFREVLSSYSIDKFDKLKPKMIQAVDDMLGYEIPELLKKFRNPYD
jgi:EH domain-containing protein 1